MQVPSENVPVDKCLALARYSARMLSKFSSNATLLELSQRMSAGAASLAEAENLLDQVIEEILALRVDVSYEDYASDNRIRRTFKMAEIADERKRGRLVSQLFPKGLSAIVRRRGDKQVEYMRDLESRIQAVSDIWPEAEAERLAITEHRTRYQAAVQARSDKESEIRSARATRDATKARFIELYTEIANLVKAEFPRNRAKADLFFDQWRARASAPATATDDCVDGPVDNSTDAHTPGEQVSA